MTTQLPHFECAFCGGGFAPGEAKSACGPCAACWGKGSSCALACPHCGYVVFGAATAMAPPREAEAKPPLNASPPLAKPCRLSQCSPGQSVRVVALDAEEESLRKLLTLGILPGTQLHLERKTPSFLCKIGRAQLALDEELAFCVQVV